MSEQRPVKMMSTGVPSTLGNWYGLCQAFFGEESEATKFIKEKLDTQGWDEEVLADEGQLLYALVQIDKKGSE